MSQPSPQTSSFDPDAYLRSKQSFDPDAYLRSKQAFDPDAYLAGKSISTAKPPPPPKRSLTATEAPALPEEPPTAPENTAPTSDFITNLVNPYSRLAETVLPESIAKSTPISTLARLLDYSTQGMATGARNASARFNKIRQAIKGGRPVEAAADVLGTVADIGMGAISPLPIVQTFTAAQEALPNISSKAAEEAQKLMTLPSTARTAIAPNVRQSKTEESIYNLANTVYQFALFKMGSDAAGALKQKILSRKPLNLDEALIVRKATEEPKEQIPPQPPAAEPPPVSSAPDVSVRPAAPVSSGTPPERILPVGKTADLFAKNIPAVPRTLEDILPSAGTEQQTTPSARAEYIKQALAKVRQTPAFQLSRPSEIERLAGEDYDRTIEAPPTSRLDQLLPAAEPSKAEQLPPLPEIPLEKPVPPLEKPTGVSEADLKTLVGAENLEYRGPKISKAGKIDYYVVHDPITNDTYSIYPDEMTEEGLRKKLETKRPQFGFTPEGNKIEPQEGGTAEPPASTTAQTEVLKDYPDLQKGIESTTFSEVTPQKGSGKQPTKIKTPQPEGRKIADFPYTDPGRGGWKKFDSLSEAEDYRQALPNPNRYVVSPTRQLYKGDKPGFAIYPLISESVGIELQPLARDLLVKSTGEYKETQKGRVDTLSDGDLIEEASKTKIKLIHQDAERAIATTPNSLLVQKPGKDLDLAWKYAAGTSDRVTNPETIRNIRNSGGNPNDYFALNSSLSDKQIAFPASTKSAVKRALEDYWKNRTPDEALRDVSFAIKNKAIDYLNKEVENSNEVKALKKNIEDRFGYQRYEFLSDFDPSLDIADVLKKEGFRFEKEEPLTREGYVGSFNGGQVTERTFENPDGRRWFVYTLPQRGDVDSFATDNVITSRPLTVDEYMELHYLLTGTKESLREAPYERLQTLPEVERMVREKIQDSGIDPDLYWNFNPDAVHGESAKNLIRATPRNIHLVKREFLEQLDKRIGNTPEASEDYFETEAQFQARKSSLLQKDSDWFDANQAKIISAAKAIRDELAKQGNTSFDPSRAPELGAQSIPASKPTEASLLTSEPVPPEVLKDYPDLVKKEKPAPQWNYEDYSDWSRQLAKNYSRAEIEKRLGNTEGERAGAARSHLRAIEATTSMTSQSQRRAQTGNVVRANYEERNALQNALEIYDNYPEKTKEAQPPISPKGQEAPVGILIKHFDKEFKATFIENYKGKTIAKIGDEVVVTNPERTSLFRMGLDDSASPHKFNERANTIDNARKYIDWLTEPEKPQLTPVSPKAESNRIAQNDGWYVVGEDAEGTYEVGPMTKAKAQEHAHAIQGGTVKNIRLAPFDQFGKPMSELPVSPKPEVPQPLTQSKLEQPVIPGRADKLRQFADQLQPTIDNLRREMTQNPTPKRMAQYRTRVIESDDMERGQQALRALADAHERGDVPPILRDIKTKSEALTLVRKGLSGAGGYYDRIAPQEYTDNSQKAKALQQLLEAKPEEQIAAAKSSGAGEPEGTPEKGGRSQEAVGEAGPQKPPLPEKARLKPLGGGELSASIIPGLSPRELQNFVEKDLVPTAQTAISGINKAVDGLKQIFVPASRSGGAKETASIMRVSLSEKARKEAVAYAALEKAHTAFATQSSQQNLDFIDSFETGRNLPNAEESAAAKTMHGFWDQRWQELNERGLLDRYVKNYFAHLFTDADMASRVFADYQKSLRGDRSFLKERTIPTVSEAMQFAATRGVPLKLISNNPVDVFMASVRSMDKAIMADDVLKTLDAHKMLRFVPLGKAAPSGYKKINDSVGRIMQYSELEKGMVYRGDYYLPEPAATIINNYLSPGVSNVIGFKQIRQAGNLLNQVQLGLSAFHAGFTTNEAVISNVALGLKQLTGGKIADGLLTLAKTPVRPVTNVIQGNQLLKDYLSHDPETDRMLRAYIDAGARSGLDKMYYNSAVQKFWESLHSTKEAWQEGNPIGAAVRAMGSALRTPGAVVEYAAKPLMQWLVPRQKTGAFINGARDIISDFDSGKIDGGERLRRLQLLQDSIDNRFGQLVYDNLFWNKTLKDILMISTRSVGWNWGTLRELGGGLLDFAKYPKQVLSGRGLEFTDRMAYTIALPAVVALEGALAMYLMTGKGPSELKDYFYPKTGKKNKDGTDERLSLPSYMKDVASYAIQLSKTIAHKLHPIWGTLYQMMNNEDFYGRNISDADALSPQWMKDYAKYTVGQFVPFSVTGYLKRREAGEGILPSAESFVGITPAPKYITRAQYQAMIDEFIHRRIPDYRSQESGEQSAAKERLIDHLQSGTGLEANELEEAYKYNFLDREGRIKKHIQTEASMPRYERLFKMLTLPEALQVYQKIPDPERVPFTEILSGKLRRARETGSPNLPDVGQIGPGKGLM